jgi:hypothetical protein
MGPVDKDLLQAPAVKPITSHKVVIQKYFIIPSLKVASLYHLAVDWFRCLDGKCGFYSKKSLKKRLKEQKDWGPCGKPTKCAMRFGCTQSQN